MIVNAKFARRFAIKQKEKVKNMQVYKRTASGRVNGGPDLRATAAYTKRFCQAILDSWERACRDATVPKLAFGNLSDLLAATGFLPSSSASSTSSATPQLRRMTTLSASYKPP